MPTQEQEALMMANEERDLDDEVPDADAEATGPSPDAGDEGQEWQHTDTEAEDEDESAMDLSAIVGGPGGRIFGAVASPDAATGSPAATAGGHFSPALGLGVGAARAWLGGAPGAGMANTPEQQQSRRGSGQRGRGRENTNRTRGRESLD